MSRVIAISNLKGGIGKTTTVVNLGAGLALKGARVLLVDVDAQGNVAMALGVRPRRTLYEVLVDGAAAADCVFNARPNLDLIAGNQALLGVQPVIAQRPDWSRVLEQGLRPLFGVYDFILIDSGGSLTVLNTNALMCATDVLVPTAVEHFSLKSIDLLFSHVTHIKGHSGAVRMIIPTMYDPRMRQSGELLDALRAQYGAIVGEPIRVNVRLSEASTEGRTIYEFDPRSRGAADYAQLVERVSELFRFTPGTQPQPQETIQLPAVEAAAQPAVSGAINGPSANPNACPNCGHPLQHATLAGYRVTYCDNCKYKTQTLAGGPRR
ncbi:MAG TPA: AAA family ATPase [Roseiflexaceae bacterium]|nr:AAA family ATPase [Roseiflexaceae bacterium]